MNQYGATLPIDSIKACVVYDSRSGQIHHRHSVLTLIGGREPTRDQIAADALRSSENRRNPPKGDLQVLHVEHDALMSGKRHRVDVERKTLVVDEP
jgi:hypothetical protein